MEIKMKENVKVDTFTFKKRVIEESLELLGRKRNYVDNDIRFVAMICFLNNMVENNLIIETLHDEEQIENIMIDTVEPLYKEHIKANPNVLTEFDDVVSQLLEYEQREVAMRNTLAGFAYDIIAELGDLSYGDAQNMINQIMTLLQTNIIKPVSKQKDESIKQEVQNDIQDLKMKALIEKFQRESVQDKNAE